MSDPSKEDPSGWRAVGAAVTIPTMLAACVLVGVLLGKWADDRFGTSPLFLLGGLFLGLAAGVRETLLILRKINSKD